MYYIIYVILLPTYFSSALQIPIDTGRTPVFLSLFLALGIAESIVRDNPVSIPLRVLTKVFGALILYVILKGGQLEATIPLEGMNLYVEFDMSTLLYTIILLSLLYGFIDAFTYFTAKEGVILTTPTTNEKTR